MKSLAWVVLTLSGLLLCACNGGGGGGSSIAGGNNPNPTTPVDTTARLAGIYSGWLSKNETNSTEDLHGAIRITGAGYFLSLNAVRIYSVNLTGSDNLASGSLRAYDVDSSKSTSFSAVGNFVETSDIDGTFEPRDHIQGPVNQNNVQSGSILLIFDAGLTDQGSSLATVAGNWSRSSNGHSLGFTISDSGAITGTGLDGCTYTGQISIDDPSIDVYHVSGFQSLCLGTQPLEGIMSFHVDKNSNNDEFINVLVTNDSKAFLAELKRQ